MRVITVPAMIDTILALRVMRQSLFADDERLVADAKSVPAAAHASRLAVDALPVALLK